MESMGNDSARRRAHRLRACVLVPLLLAIAQAAHAVDEDGRLWANLHGQVRLGESVLAGLLVQTRHSDDMDHFERVLLRPSLNVVLDGWLDIGAGYDLHLIQRPRETEEHRAFQEASFATPLAGVGIGHRFRLEERFGKTFDGAAVRLRYLLAFTSPDLALGVRGVVRNEVFLNFDRRGPTRRTGLGEDHAFAGFQRSFGEPYLFEVGYQAQVLRPANAEAIVNHTLLVGLRARY